MGKKEEKKTEEVEEVKEETSEESSSPGTEKEELSHEKEIEQRDEEISKLKKELEEQKDQMLRRQADFENYKKRALKQQEAFKKTAIKDFALDIININDDLLRAIEASGKMEKEEGETNHSSFMEGVEMISKRIIETLKNYGIEEIEALDMPFDPSVHEAVEMEDSEEHEVDTVTKVHQKGFRLDELIIRSSKVKVSRAVAKKSGDSKSE